MKMTYKKILCLALAVVMTAGVVPAFEIVSKAAKTVYTSEDGQWQYTKVTDTRLSRFNGPIKNKSAKITRYLGDDVNVIIPEEIDGMKVYIIGEKCFY